MKLSGIAALFTIFAIVASINGCEPESETEHVVLNVVKIENVVRVFMHKEDDYTLVIQEDNSSIIRFERLYHMNTKIYADVPSNEKMWATYTITNHGSGKGELHIHSVKEINGAGWNNGKFGSGTTEVIK